MSSKLLTDDEFFGDSGGGGSSLLSDDEFMGGGAPPAPAAKAKPDFYQEETDYLKAKKAAQEPAAPSASSDQEFIGGAAKPVPQASGGFIDQVKKGFIAGLVDQNPQMVGNAMEAIAELSEPSGPQHAGELIGGMVPIRPGGKVRPIEETPQRLRELADKVKEWGNQGSETRQPNVPSFTSIRTDSLSNMVGDAADYLGYLMGSGIGTSAPGIAAGVAGAAATKSPLGFIASAAGPSYVQNLGDTYGALLENTGVQKAMADGKITRKQVASIAAEAAIPMAALDAVSLETVVGLNATGLKQTIVKRLMQHVLTGALTEGTTEGIQQVIQEAAIDVAGGDKTLAQQAVSVIDNAIGGLVAGGAMSAGASPTAGHMAHETAPPLTEQNIPQGAANADTLFGQESAGGAPPPSADTAAGGPPPPPAATPTAPAPSVPEAMTPADIERERPNSPRLTPEDRASPLPNDLIDDGKKIFEEALGGSKKQATAEPTTEIAPLGQPAAPPASAAPVPGMLNPATGEVASGPLVPDHEFLTSQHPAEPNPTPAQAAAGNYQHRHVQYSGLDISIENEQGSIRRGTDANGKPWQVEMPVAYGYVKKTTGADGDQFDVYLGPSHSDKVYVVDQINPDTKTYDEHKAMLGFASREEAIAAYEKGFSDGKGAQRIGAVTEMPMFGFKQWLKTGDTTQPLSYAGQAASKPSLDELMAKTREESAARSKQAEELASAGKPVKMVGQSGRTALVGPDMSEPGKFRITRFDEKGPVGHTVYNDFRSAIEDALRERYTPQAEPKAAPVDVKQRTAPVQKGPRDIIQFLASQGGVQDFKGELRAIDAHKVFVPGVGKLVREKGVPLDTAREAAAEMGYFDGKYGDRDTAVAKSTVADLLDLIAETRRGNRQYASGEQGTAPEPQKVDRLQEEIEAVAKEYGLKLNDKVTSDILDKVSEGMSVEEAAERVAIEFEHETHDSRGQGEPSVDDIPFDIPEAPNAGAAVKAGEGVANPRSDRQGPDEGAAGRGENTRPQPGSAEPHGSGQEVSAEDRALLADLPDGYRFIEGKGELGRGKWGVASPDKPNTLVWGLNDTKAQAAREAKQRLASVDANDREKAAKTEREQAIAKRLLAGEEATDADLRALNLKISSQFDYLSPVVQRLFGISGRKVREAMGDALKHIDNGMGSGTMVWVAPAKKALRNAAAWVNAQNKPQTETVDTEDGKREQTVIPGTEKISQGEQAQRGADERMKPKAPQKDAGELFDTQARSERQDELFSLRREGPRQQGIPATAVNIAPFDSDAAIKAHPDYLAAKAGDQKSAERMVADLVPDSSLEQAASSFGTDVIYAPVIAHEASGHNAIPWTLADYYAERTGAKSTTDIYQANRVFHTGAKAMERLAVRATFGGDVVAGGRYVLVDDVTVMGSTLADMANYIRQNGGEVAGTVTLANASRTGVLHAPKHRIGAIERRFGDVIRSELHLDPASLTAPEAEYLHNFRDANALRDRIASSLRERGERLGAKGVQQTPEDQGEGRLKRAGEALQPSDTFKSQAQAVGKRLRAELDRLGLKDIGLRISENLDLMVEGKLLPADGSYFRKLITVSLEADNPDAVLDHEAIHGLRDIGAFSKDEWAILARKSRKEWVDRYGIPETYADFSEDIHVEEGVAHAYADWRAGRSMDGIIAKAFKKIRSVLQAIGRAFGKDFRTAADVFEQVASGEVGNRPRTIIAADRMRRVMREGQGEELFRLRTPRDAEEAQQTMQGMIARGQPLDRVLRMPFDWFGGVDDKGRWKPGLHITEQAAKIITESKIDPNGRFGWLAGPVEAARAGLIDRYGLSKDYIARERQRTMDERSIVMQGAEVLKTLADQNVGAEEARVLQAILNGEAVDNSDMQKLAAPIRQAIDELGQEAVTLGLISSESYERNRGSYLHRVYTKNEAEQNNLQKLVGQIMGRKRKQIIGDEMKGRGMFWDVDNARLMKDIASFQEGRRGGPVLGEKFRVVDNVLSPTEDMLSGEERGKVARRIFMPADQEVPLKYVGQEWRDNGVWEVRKSDHGKVTLWRDYTKAERAKMGEILDARYTIGKTYLLMAHDLATGRFYKDIAENEDWTTSTEPPTKWVNGSDSILSRLSNDREVAWVKVPDSEIPQSGGKKKWGALAGKFVRAEIWRDMNEIDVMNRPSTWRMLLTQWKLNKTARNPVVHMNNVMSNLVLMDMQDIRMQDLAAGIRSFINKDQHWQDANEHGVFGADLMTQEIRKNVLQPILDEITKQSQDGAENSFLARAGTLGKLADKLWGGLKFADKKMRLAYQIEDDVFRLASYRARLARGESPEEAAAHAREQFLDYNIHAPWVNAARNSVLPFISYTYRATPLIAKAMATRPWKLAKYAMIAYALNALAYAWDDKGDEDKERASLRDEEQGYTWLGTPRMLRMPFRDAHGLPMFLDVRRWIPAGDIFDTNQGSSAVPIPAPLQFGGPLMMAAELALNRQGFTGDPIRNELTDNWWDTTNKVGDYLWKSWMPSAPWVPNSWYWTKIENAVSGATDAKGRPYSIPQAVSSSVGVKVKSQDVEMGLFWHYKDLKDQENDLRSQARQLARQRDRGLISQKAFDQGMASIVAKVGRIADRAKELQRVQQKKAGEQ